MPLTQTAKRLTRDEIVALASDCLAVECPICYGEGFVAHSESENLSLLCPTCQGSGAVLVPKPQPKPREVTGRSLLAVGAFCLALAGLLLWVMFR